MLTSDELLNSYSWQDTWEKLDKKEHKSGQAIVFLVKRKDSNNSNIGFLKLLKDQLNQHHRKRMKREVSAYETLCHPSIPKLKGSNVVYYKNKKCKLYIVQEFIKGPSLRKAVSESLPSIDEAIECILKLCEIIQYCHNEDVLHRDIKPDNIILRNGNWHDPVLVDFGLTSYDLDNLDIKSIDQEIGNRFLKLPEHQKGSSLKYDCRSDVTLCAGIFLYLLSGHEPIQFLDQDGLKPHQRNTISSSLSMHYENLNELKLKQLFEIAFEHSIDKRFQSFNDLTTKIRQLNMKYNNYENTNYITNKDKVLEFINSENNLRKIRNIEILEKYKTLIRETMAEIANEFKLNDKRIFSPVFSMESINSSLDEIKVIPAASSGVF